MAHLKSEDMGYSEFCKQVLIMVLDMVCREIAYCRALKIVA